MKAHSLVFWVKRIAEVLVPRPSWRLRLDSPRSWLKLLPLAGFLLVIGGMIVLLLMLRQPSTPCVFKIPKPVKGAIPGRPIQCVRLEVAETNSAIVRGLSGRRSMPRDHGMLFVFAEPDRQCMWMKEMNFNLDMLWLDENKRVMHIERNLSPDTYPKAFCNPGRAKYVVEVNAGIVDAAGIQIGQHLKF